MHVDEGGVDGEVEDEVEVERQSFFLSGAQGHSLTGSTRPSGCGRGARQGQSIEGAD